MEVASFNPLALDMSARDADNIRAIATAPELLSPPRFIAALPEISRQLQLTRFAFGAAIERHQWTPFRSFGLSSL